MIQSFLPPTCTYDVMSFSPLLLRYAVTGRPSSKEPDQEAARESHASCLRLTAQDGTLEGSLCRAADGACISVSDGRPDLAVHGCWGREHGCRRLNGSS